MEGTEEEEEEGEGRKVEKRRRRGEELRSWDEVKKVYFMLGRGLKCRNKKHQLRVIFTPRNFG